MQKLTNFVENNLPLVHSIYMKIAEPRFIRLLLFAIYILAGIIGLAGLLDPPNSFQASLGALWKVNMMFGCILLGSLFSTVSVLPGIWWLERTGLIALGTGVGFYILILIDRNSSLLGLGVSIMSLLTFLIRWIEIRRYQLAPREG